jgi:hypothetical protein
LRRRKTRTKRPELGAALAAALCLTACGGAKTNAPPPPPTFVRSLASSLAAQSDGVAAALAEGDSCRALTLAQRLQQDTIAAINNGRVKPALQEQLSSAVNALVARVRCVPPAAPPPAPPPKEHGDGKHKDKGHHRKHGKDD